MAAPVLAVIPNHWNTSWQAHPPGPKGQREQWTGVDVRTWLKMRAWLRVNSGLFLEGG